MSIPIEVIVTCIGLAGAGLGYAIREYRNRVRPFFQIVHIDGAMIKGDDRVEIPEQVSKKLTDTFYLDELGELSALSEVCKVYAQTNEMVNLWQQDKPAVEEILRSPDEARMADSLCSALNSESIDEWLMRMLVSNRITVNYTPAEDSKEMVPVHEDAENKGMVWLFFPRKATSFGSHLSNAAVRAKCKAFIDAVRFMHVDTIKNTFDQFKQIVESSYTKAVECRPVIKELVNERSRWCFKCYLANLSSHPIMLENTARITVRDSNTKVRFVEACYLVLWTVQEGGKRILSDTRSPIVVRPGGDAEFAFITDMTQSGMDLGKAMRECYDRAESRCHITVAMRKVGLLKRQKCRSAKSTFSDLDE